MGARTDVAVFLTDALPDTWTVHAAERELDGVTRPTVMCGQRTITEPSGLRTAGLELTLLVPGDSPETVEDALEDALDVLLDALTPLPATDLTATRGTYQTTLSAYSVTFSVPLKRKEN